MATDLLEPFNLVRANDKIVVLMSGGLDSTVLACALKRAGAEVLGISFRYGQRHARELSWARSACMSMNISHKLVDLDPLQDLMKGSSQTDRDIAVPHGHYADESMKVTVVPNRNMILLALAGAYAISEKAYQVAIAAHAGDHAIYPDCRPEFMASMRDALGLCDYKPVKLLRPFINHTKADIVRVGVHFGAPLEMTYSCYEGDEKHCGKCGTCVERREAFQLAGASDPTVYAG